MTDIYISLDQLTEVTQQLDAIVDEFAQATSHSEQLEAAIGNPFGRGELRSKARDFEERWDRKREELHDGLQGVRDHVQAVVDGVQQWDADTAIALSDG